MANTKLPHGAGAPRSVGRGLALVGGLIGIWAIIVVAIATIPGLREGQRFRWFMFSGALAGTPFVMVFLRDGRIPSILRACGVGLASLLIVGTWVSVVQDGYYGDASPLYRWRMTGAHRAEGLARPADQTLEVSADRVQTSDYQGPKWNYSEFLGPNRDAKIAQPRLEQDWIQSPPTEKWRVTVGEGWSSFAITERFAITQEQLGDDEAVVCRDLQSGDVVWTTRNEGVRFGETYGGFGPRATPTVFHGEVYALGATGDLMCIETATGELIWERNILSDANAENIKWGMSGSPLVFDETVVVCPGGLGGNSVVAYHRMTGERVWNTGSSQAAYSSPMLVNFADHRQIVLLNGPGLEAYAADTGELLWSYPWIVNANMMTSVTQPVVVPSDQANSCQFFLSGGYGKGCVLLEVTQDDDGFQATELWQPNRQMKSKFNTIVQHNGFVYGMDDQVLTCLDLRDGSRRWKKGRYGYGQLLFVHDVLLVQAENGDVALVRPSPERFEELTRISPLSRKTWNNPALRGNLLIIRNDQEAVCLELPLPASSDL